MTEDRSTELAIQSAITLFGNLGGKILGFLFLTVVTRIVSPAVFGIFIVALSVVRFTQGFADLNLHRAVDYFVPQYLDSDEPERAGSVVRRVIALGTVSTIVCAVVVAATAPWVGPIFEEDQVAVILPAVALVMPLMFYFRAGLAVFNSVKQMQYRVITRNIVRPLTKVLATVGFVVLVGGLWGLVVGYLLALAVAIVVAAVLILRTAGWVRTTSAEPTDLQELLEYSAPLMFAGVMYAVISQVDFLVVGYFLASERVAEYRVVFQLASNLTIFVGSVAPVFKPMIAEVSDDDRALRGQFQSAARWLALLTLPPAITMAVAPQPYLRLLFTETYAGTGAGLAVTVLAVGYAIHAAVGPEGIVIEGIGRTRLSMVNTATFLAVNAVVDVLLVPRLGIVGAAVGTAAALATAVLLGVSELYLLRRVHPLSWPLAKMLAAGGATVLIGLTTKALVPGAAVVVVLPIAVSAVFLLAVVAVRGFTAEDLTVARRLDDRLGFRVFTPVVERGHS